MKRILVLLAVLALTLALFAGCGRYGVTDDGTNVSTTDNGVVNGTNPDGGVAEDAGRTGGTAGANSGTGTGMAAGTGTGSDAA